MEYPSLSRQSSNVEDRRSQGLLGGLVLDTANGLLALPSKTAAFSQLISNTFAPRITGSDMQDGLRELGAMLPGRSLVGTSPVSLTPELSDEQKLLQSQASAAGSGLGSAAPTLSNLLRGVK